MRIKATTYIRIDDAAWKLAYGTTGSRATKQAISDVEGQIREAFTGSKWDEVSAVVTEWSHVELLDERR